MEGLDKRAPFTATGGIIPPEFRNIKTPCYILDEKALIKNYRQLNEQNQQAVTTMINSLLAVENSTFEKDAVG